MRSNIGAADRLDFTAIGLEVNLVSRLEGLCRPLGQPVPVSGAVAAETATLLVSLGEHVLRGIAAPCTVFALPDARAALRSQCWVRDREVPYIAWHLRAPSGLIVPLTGAPLRGEVQ